MNNRPTQKPAFLISAKNWMICLFLASLTIISQTVFGQVQSTSPENGSLLIIGGGRLDSSIYNIFMEKAGGPEGPIVIIPTAGGDDPEENDPDFKRLISRYKDRGFKDVAVLHTTDPEEANQSMFYEPLMRAKGVWFTGGRQWRLVDAYAGTKTLDAIWAVVNRGGIIAGSSAGATIQGSYLARGDSNTNTIMMGDHEEGFSFLTNVAIDQHVIARNRQFDIFEILDAHPDLLGIGLDEGSGILVENSVAEVVGRSYVLIYDGKFWHAPSDSFKEVGAGQQKYYFLKKGMRYDLKNRRVVTN